MALDINISMLQIFLMLLIKQVFYVMTLNNYYPKSLIKIIGFLC